jgi:transcriptional regulator with XRE-family HTH domain
LNKNPVLRGKDFGNMDKIYLVPNPQPEPPEGFVDNTVYRYKLDENGNKVFIGTMDGFPEGWERPKQFREKGFQKQKEAEAMVKPMENRDELMSRAKALMREGLSQNKAAKEVGVSSSSLSSWLKEERLPMYELERKEMLPATNDEAGKYEALAKSIGALVDRKNKQYGDAFNRGGSILEVLYPDGVRPEQYRDMLGVIRVVDKLFRVANGKQGQEDPWQDIAGYGLLGTGE